MALTERLLEDLRNAMRQRDEVRRSTIRLVRAAIQNEEIAQRKPLDDPAIIRVLSSMLRQHQESIAEFRRGNREDLVEREEAELAILRQYMPEQLSLQEITDLSRQAIAAVGATGPSDMGRVMGRLMPQVFGRAEGAQVSQVVNELLASA